MWTIVVAWICCLATAWAGNLVPSGQLEYLRLRPRYALNGPAFDGVGFIHRSSNGLSHTFTLLAVVSELDNQSMTNRSMAAPWWMAPGILDGESKSVPTWTLACGQGFPFDAFYWINRPHPVGSIGTIEGGWKVWSVPQENGVIPRVALMPNAPGLVVNMTFWFTTIWTVTGVFRGSVRMHRSRRGLCAECGFNAGRKVLRCPECGSCVEHIGVLHRIWQELWPSCHSVASPAKGRLDVEES